MIATIALPRLMRIGAGASLELGNILSQLGLSRPLIVTDSHLVELGKLEKLMGSLDSSKVRATLFSDVVLDPTVASVEACLAFLRAGNYDCVVGFGGGSSMDTAKAVAVLAVHGGAMSSYKVPHVQDSPGLPIIAIPTTAGTGSETTRFTIISDEKTNEKMLCIGLGFLPTAALVDYEQSFSMPKGLTAATGLDALCHALEGLCFEDVASVLAEHRSSGDAGDCAQFAARLCRPVGSLCARSRDAGRVLGRDRIFQQLSRPHPWHGPPHRRFLPCGTWVVGRHADAGGY